MNWMLSEAIEQLSRAERMHRQFFSLTATAEPRGSTWEPPIDVIETDDEVLIFVALPGVDPDGVEARGRDPRDPRPANPARRTAPRAHPPTRIAAGSFRAPHRAAGRLLRRHETEHNCFQQSRGVNFDQAVK